MAHERGLAKRERGELEAMEPWNSFRDMERMFRNFFGIPMMRPSRMWSMGLAEFAPDVDIKETDKDLVISATVPGMSKDDINIDVTNDRITISGERKTEEEKPGERYHVREQSYGSFSVSYALPVDVKSEDVKATYKNGLLEIILPKAAEAATHKIKIEEA
ncbi:MAG: Hsp20/alpha crystallin family protein [Armatimonadota bacterium]|nr:Hsp20/alpha crystallin family protein [bacterium]